MKNFSCSLAIFCISALAIADDIDSIYSISTFKSGNQIGTQKINSSELRNSAIALASEFKEGPVRYQNLVDVANMMTAMDRCFNLYGSKVALASVKSGFLDASANAEVFLKNSIRSIEEVNAKTTVTCEMYKTQ